MAAIVLLKHLPTGKEHSFYTVDAREVLEGKEKESWEFVKRLDRNAKMIERGISAVIDPKTGGALEYFGDRLGRSAEEAEVDAARSPVEPQAATSAVPKRGQRGGGPQEPASATTE